MNSQNIITTQVRAPLAIPHNMSCCADEELAIKILLVEDEYGDMLLTLHALNATKTPYEIDRISYGDEVLPYLMNGMQSRLPDLMLLDMGLPGTNGFDVLEMLAAAPVFVRAVPIVILTGYTNFDYLKKTYDLPIYGYLTKPICAKEIGAIIGRVLATVEAERKEVVAQSEEDEG